MSTAFALTSWIIRGKSVLRGYFHEALKTTPILSGIILDIGGTKGDSATYRSIQRFAPGSQVRTLNIDPKGEPEIVADAHRIPLEDQSIDQVLCVNVLEHVENPEQVIKEAARVLKSGGWAIWETPFLINVHAHPYDYWRFTDRALQQLLESNGFTEIEVKQLGNGPFVAAASILQPFFKVFFVIPFLCAYGLDQCLWMLRPNWKHRWPLGYLVICKKA